MNKNATLATAVALACGITAGCASQTRTEAEFGDSVRAMIASQTYDSYAANSPDPNPVTGGDGARLEKIVEAYRGDVPQPQSVTVPMQTGKSTSR